MHNVIQFPAKHSDAFMGLFKNFNEARTLNEVSLFFSVLEEFAKDKLFLAGEEDVVRKAGLEAKARVERS